MNAIQALRRNAERLIASCALSSLLYLVNGAGGTIAFVGFLSISLPCVYVIGFMLDLNGRDYAGKALRDRFVEYMGRLSYYRTRGGSRFRAMIDASEGIDSETLSGKVRESFRRHLMGEEFRIRFSPKEGVDGEYAQVASSRPGDVIRNHAFYLKRKRAEIEESAQRYATLNMFLSTILPSFLVFAFIGESILSQGGFGILLFSIVLLVLIPTAYAVGNVVMWRRLHV